MTGQTIKLKDEKQKAWFVLPTAWSDLRKSFFFFGPFTMSTTSSSSSQIFEFGSKYQNFEDKKKKTKKPKFWGRWFLDRNCQTQKTVEAFWIENLAWHYYLRLPLLGYRPLGFCLEKNQKVLTQKMVHIYRALSSFGLLVKKTKRR